MRIDSCSHHLKHPFSFERSSFKLNVRQKLAALAGLLLLPLGIVPGLIAFYAIAYSFKAKIIKNNVPLDPNVPDFMKTNTAAKKRFSHSLSSSSSARPASNALPANSADQIFLLLKATKDPQEIKQLLAQLPLASIADLHKNQGGMFELLFAKALAADEKDYIKACLGCLNKKELGQFLKNQNLLDVKLNFSNNHFHTNAALLKATIPYFASMFRWDMKETRSAEIDLQSTDPVIFSALIDFAFFKQITITESNYLSLYERAGFYGLDALQKQCCEWMRKNISERTFQDILDLASTQKLNDLKNDCEAWISVHLGDFEDKDLQSLIHHYQLNLVTTQEGIQDQLLKCFEEKKDLTKDNSLKQKLKRLETLDLTGFEKFSAAQINQLISLCPNVKDLISHHAAMNMDAQKTDLRTTLAVISKSAVRYLIQEERLLLIVKTMPKLESLTLEGNCIDRFPDKISLKSLKKLSLINSVTLDAISLAPFKGLEELNIDCACLPESSQTKDILSLGQQNDLQRLRIRNANVKIDEIESFTKLKSLILENVNENINTQPKNLNLSLFVNLETLILPENTLSRDDLVSLTKLHTLHLNVGNLDDLSILSQLTHLQELKLYNVQAKHLNSLPKLKNLKTLALITVPYGKIEQNPTFFADFEPLENLELSGFVAKNSFLIPLPKLKSLMLKRCSNFDISNLKDLRRLDILASSEMSGSLPALQKLKVLNINESKIADFTPIIGPSLKCLSLRKESMSLWALPSATGLKKLDLSGCQVPTGDFASLGQLTTLEELNLSSTSIKDLSVISTLSNLKVLDLSYCEQVESLDPLAKLTELHTLYLIYRNAQNSPEPASLAPLSNLKKLKKVNYAVLK